jgi:hypothetical protein
VPREPFLDKFSVDLRHSTQYGTFRNDVCCLVQLNLRFCGHLGYVAFDIVHILVTKSVLTITKVHLTHKRGNLACSLLMALIPIIRTSKKVLNFLMWIRPVRPSLTVSVGILIIKGLTV